jgi:protein involved in polysaccharide export with SLBB domain
MLSTLSAFARRVSTIHRSTTDVSSRALVVAALVGVSTLGAQAPSGAQTQPIPTPRPNSPKREVLGSALQNFETCARTQKDNDRRSDCVRQAQMIRKRLAEGDFQSGHRILLFVVGDSALSDTFTVRADQKLQLPNLPEMSLAGVLDSELQGYLETQLARYIRNPSVRAQALLRVSVTGNVANPGFYSIRTDTPVSDVIMNAGGPAPSADVRKVELRRGNEVAVKREGIQTAIRSELTMADIGARPGDELYVPAKPDGSRWAKVAGAAASATGIIWTIVYITRR